MNDAREALAAIYQDEFEAQENTHDGTATWKVKLRDLGIVLTVDLTDDYPGEVPPNLRLELDSWPVDGDAFVQTLLMAAKELHQPGECCIFNCVEYIKEAFQDPRALMAGCVRTTSATEPQNVQQVLPGISDVFSTGAMANETNDVATSSRAGDPGLQDLEELDTIQNKDGFADLECAVFEYQAPQRPAPKKSDAKSAGRTLHRRCEWREAQNRRQWCYYGEVEARRNSLSLVP